jgi:hypothetical protein
LETISALIRCRGRGRNQGVNDPEMKAAVASMWLSPINHINANGQVLS